MVTEEEQGDAAGGEQSCERGAEGQEGENRWKQCDAKMLQGFGVGCLSSAIQERAALRLHWPGGTLLLA